MIPKPASIMVAINARLLVTLDESVPEDAGIISWATPVSYFGALERSSIATVGLNPSNREFVDAAGNELKGNDRRFHTLASLGVQHWREISISELERIQATYDAYFQQNPYQAWFKRLDKILSGLGASYYGQTKPACHLDLVPFATHIKWGALPRTAQSNLRQLASECLGRLVQFSEVQILLLNGSAVLKEFIAASSFNYAKEKILAAQLPRASGTPVDGYGYYGVCTEISGIWLDREILVVGWNHNIQSSYGVTNGVVEALTTWVKEKVGIWNESERQTSLARPDQPHR